LILPTNHIMNLIKLRAGAFMLRLFIQYVLLIMFLISCSNKNTKQNQTSQVSSIEKTESDPLLAEKKEVESLVAEFNNDQVSVGQLVKDLDLENISRASFEEVIKKVVLEEEDLNYLKEQNILTEKKMAELKSATINNLSYPAEILLKDSQTKQVEPEEVIVALHEGNISLAEFEAIAENTFPKNPEEKMKKIALSQLKEEVQE
jgi:hypothetical protein